MLNNGLFPNQFVNARLLVKTLRNVVTVPTAASQRGAPRSYVYVINADGRVSVRPVNIGSTDGPMAAVNSRRLRVIPRFRPGRPHALHSRPSEVQKVLVPLA
jgi:multidrug efflux pump subunit AcrA (membrane-fusion protein)